MIWRMGIESGEKGTKHSALPQILVEGKTVLGSNIQLHRLSSFHCSCHFFPQALGLNL
jgi:hypothetical protein